MRESKSGLPMYCKCYVESRKEVSLGFRRSQCIRGCRDPSRNGCCQTSGAIFQMSIPSLEFLRSDWPANFCFAGSFPSMASDSRTERPYWWDEVVSGVEQKDIIVLSQGTMNIDYSELILPAMEGLRDRPNTFLIVVLQIKEALLPTEKNAPIIPNRQPNHKTHSNFTAPNTLPNSTKSSFAFSKMRLLSSSVAPFHSSSPC